MGWVSYSCLVVEDAEMLQIIGLVRSVGPKFRRDDKITVNAILPAFVVTGLAPAGLVDAMPKEHLTPMSTILKAYDSFLESDMSGETVECSGTELYYRKKAEYPNKSQVWLAEDTDGFWKGSYGGKRAGEQKGVANGK
jgi:15-hydroxyprostaglandin dehydrogenase (NAD)